MQIKKITTDAEIAYPSEFPQLAEGRYCASSMPKSAREGDVRLVLRPGAVRQIFEFIHWGDHVPENRNEQAGILYGYLATEEAADGEPRRWGVICGVIAANAEHSSQIEVEISGQEWARMDHELDQLNLQRARLGKQAFQKMGWFHTHPNGLDPFYSAMDYRLQEGQMVRPDRFGVVFNPHRQKWAVYAGPESTPVNGIMELDDELLAKYSFQPLSPQEAWRPLQGLTSLLPRWSGRRPQRQPDAQPAQPSPDAIFEVGRDAEVPRIVDTYYADVDGIPAPVQSVRNQVLRESYDLLTLLPELMGSDCQAAVKQFDTDAGIRLQIVEAFRWGWFRSMDMDDVAIVRYVPCERWQQAIQNHYRSQKSDDRLWVYLVSMDGKICLMRPTDSAPVFPWGARYVR